MSVPAGGRAWLQRYGAVVAAFGFAIAVSLRPSLLTPLALWYLRLGFRYHDWPLLRRHDPPYLVAALGLWLLLTGLALAILLARQLAARQALARLGGSARRPLDPGLAALARSAGLDDRLILLASPSVFGFCAGLVRPRVYLSTGLLGALSAKEIEAVLRHELSHARRRDPLRLFVVQSLAILLAPFPLARALGERVRLDAELAADRAALRRVSRPILASALIKVVRARSQPLPGATIGLTPTEARIDALMGRAVRMPLPWPDLALSLVMLAALGGLGLQLAAIDLCRACPHL